MVDESWILAIQAFRSPPLDALARGLSFLGDEPFYLLLLPALYWAVDRGTALRVTVLLLLSTWLNAALKGALDLPRPSAERVAVLDPRGSGGLPSGHAQNAVVVWGFLASRRPSPPVLAGAALLAGLIGASRLYLGAHFPGDVLVGWAVGLAFLAAFLLLEGRILHALRHMGTAALLSLAAFLPLLFLALYRDHEALPGAATLLGAGVGAVLERRWVRFTPRSGGGTARILRVTVGLAAALGIWAGLREPLLFLGDGGRALRYVLLGLWITVGAPALFRALGLAGREGGEPAPDG